MATVTNEDVNFDESVDNIVIGSGVGGLSVASLLSQLKRKEQTLLLEQHYTIGGNLNTFEREEERYPFNVGVHWVGEMNPGSKAASFMDALQPPNKAVKWDALPEQFETLYLGGEELQRYETNRKMEKIQEAFPEQKDSIGKYFAYAEKAANAFEPSMAYKMMPRWLVKLLLNTGLFRLTCPGYYKYIRPLSEVMDEFGLKGDLRGVLTYNWMEYGCTPESAPFILHAYVMKHFKEGLFFPQGGASAVAQAIVAQIEACGGQVRTKSNVKQILVESGRAVGVELDNGTKIRARKAVISNAGYPNTFERLLPAQYTLDETLNSLKGSFTFLFQQVGLKGDHDADWKLPHHIPWIYPNSNMEGMMTRFPESLSDALATLKPEDLPMGISLPCSKDKSWNDHHPGISTLEIMAAVPFSWFAEWEEGAPGTHGAKYEDAKKQLAQLLWTRARQVLISAGTSNKLPVKVEDLDFHDLATPLTFAHFLCREHGAVYGLEESCRRLEPDTFFLKLRPKVPKVRGLYMSGEDVISDGIVSSMMGGVLAVCKIMGVMDPVALMKKLKKVREQQ